MSTSIVQSLVEQLLQSTTLYDVTMPIRPGMPVWRNNPEKLPEFETTTDYQRGHSWETRLHLGAHTGTHLDAPLHMVEHGDTIESIRLDQLVRMCRVVDLTHVEDAIHASDVDSIHPLQHEFILLKTRNSFNDGWDDNFVFIAEDGARRLADAGIAGVGIDALGVERSQPDHMTHIQLMRSGCVIVEGLRLAEVSAGSYFMVAAPIRLEGIEASLARVILFG